MNSIKRQAVCDYSSWLSKCELVFCHINMNTVFICQLMCTDLNVKLLFSCLLIYFVVVE